MNTHKRRSPGGELGGSTTNETQMRSQTSLTQLPSRAPATGHRPTRCLTPHAAGAETFLYLKGAHQAETAQSGGHPESDLGLAGACLHLGGLQPSRPRHCVSSAVLLLNPQAGAS